MKTCRLQEDCPHFTTGDNKPRNHDVRHKHPCKQYLAMSCRMPLEISYFYGEEVACDLGKIARIKKGLKGGTSPPRNEKPSDSRLRAPS